jgi:hypothetical protein
MRARTLLAALGLLAFAPAAKAQMAESLAATSFEYYPRVSTDDRPGSLELKVFRASAGVPIAMAKRTTLLVGAAYELIDVNPQGAVGDFSFQLHAPKLTVGVAQGFGERWGVMAFVDGGFASDFSDAIGSEDVLLSVTAVGTYRLNESFTLGAGAAYDRRSGKLAPLPALLLKWRISERTRVRGFAPAFLAAEYHALDWLDLGVRGSFEGNRFHLGQERFDVRGLELAYSTLNVGPRLTFHASEWLHFDVYAAGAVYRRYEMFQNDESLARHSLPASMTYGARFWIGPSSWNESQDGTKSKQ